AAECLCVVCCNQEAVDLYTTVLKSHLSSPDRRDNSFWYLVIQCAHTASNPEHAEVIQNIIRAEISRFHFQDSAVMSMAYRFLLHMLLAFICSRNSNSEGV